MLKNLSAVKMGIASSQVDTSRPTKLRLARAELDYNNLDGNMKRLN